MTQGKSAQLSQAGSSFVRSTCDPVPQHQAQRCSAAELACPPWCDPARHDVDPDDGSCLHRSAEIESPLGAVYLFSWSGSGDVAIGVDLAAVFVDVTSRREAGELAAAFTAQLGELAAVAWPAVTA